MRNIVLIGLPGSGKTTVGKAAADQMKRTFVDMDAQIVQTAGMPVTEIFARYGEDYFRNLETLTAYRCARMSGTVIATGGGIVIRPENIEVLRQTGQMIYLARTASEIVQDIAWDTRPLLAGGAERLFALEQARAPLYRQAADHILSNGLTREKAVAALLAIMAETGYPNPNHIEA